MTIEELKEKYRSSPLLVRFVIMITVGLVVPAYYYLEESKVVESSIEAEQQKLASARTKLNEQTQAKTKIPSREKALNEADKEINRIRRHLPPSFEVHEILRKVEIAANENNVELLSFQPIAEVDKALYVEMPFNLRVEGKFIDVTRYLDDLLHFETLTKVSAVDYVPSDLHKGLQVTVQNETVQGAISRKKQNAGVTANVTLLVYKTVGM